MTNTSAAAPSLACYNMIEQQIRPWDVLDEGVLSLYRAFRREDFVQPHLAALAYSDTELPIHSASDALMLAPKLEARMLQELSLQGNEQVLHIGTGSGFFALLLSRLVARVITVEIDPTIHEEAARRLRNYEAANIECRCGDGLERLNEESGRYDVIVLTGALAEAPEFSLKTKGKLMGIFGSAPAMTLSLYLQSSAEHRRGSDILETVVPLLQNTHRHERFSF